jgi:SAM-dependent methyltransferase
VSKATGASVLATTGEVETGLSQRQRLLARLRASGVQLRGQAPEEQLVARRLEEPERPAEPLAEPPPGRPPGRPLGQPPREAPRRRWDETRIAAVQKVWGKGFLAPGGKEALLHLIAPLEVERGMRVLDLGAGLGGSARVLAKRFGAEVTGLEADRCLAEAGQALSRRILSSRATIHSLAERHEVLAPRAFDRIFSKDVLFTVRDKARVLAVAEALLADGGRMMIVDYVVAADARRSPAVEAWKAADPARPAPWSIEEYIEMLTGLGLGLRIDDVTGIARWAINRSWAGLLAKRRRPTLDQEAAQALLDEARLWSLRSKLLKSGELRVCRILAER